MDHLQRLANPPPNVEQPDLPFPDYAGTIIEGPRIRLRYGSAPTEICVEHKVWRRTDRGDRFTYQGRWRSIHDWRNSDCIVGKRVQRGDWTGIAEEDEDGFLQFRDEEDGTYHACLQPEDLTVLPDDTNLNMFERAITEHLKED